MHQIIVCQLGVDILPYHLFFFRAGIAKWPKANASRAFLVGVQGFNSLSPHVPADCRFSQDSRS